MAPVGFYFPKLYNSQPAEMFPMALSHTQVKVSSIGLGSTALLTCQSVGLSARHRFRPTCLLLILVRLL